MIDIEASLKAGLTALLPDVDGVGTDTPADLAGKVFLKVTSPTGSASTIDDVFLVDLDAFAPTREGAFQLARDGRKALTALAATAPLGGLIDTVRTATLPSWIDYRNPAVQRVHASYRVVARTHQREG